MTRIQARDNLEAITHWANGGSLWYLSAITKNIEYTSTSVLFFNSSRDHQYIIEDKFFKERKAFALGKDIEGKMRGMTKWSYIRKPTWRTRNSYRIAPEVKEMTREEISKELGYEVKVNVNVNVKVIT